MDELYIDIQYDVDFIDEEAEDVTEEMKLRIPIRDRDSIKKILKYGKLYKIFFCFGYTAFGKEMRYARHKGEVKWYAKIATEERTYGYTLEHYIEEFKRNHINFDGKTIPLFIDTIEDVIKRYR